MAQLSRLGLSVVTLGLMLPLVGCQTLGGSGLIQSTASAQLTPLAAASIASEMVEALVAHLAPGSVTIRLPADPSTFGQAFEEALRTKGYAIVASNVPSNSAQVELAYAVEPLDGSIMVRISAATFDLTRLYQLSGEQAAASGPLSVLRRDEVAADD